MVNMDCNKEEANMAKELAEKKFAEKDLVGAKNIALKAEKLYPELDGLPQLLATLDVHISAGNRINGVVDWYGVLGVEPSADDSTIKKCYKKLALVLHPDKNKSVGAEGAFKILSEAWSLLSDKSKRATYDQNRNGRYADIPDWKPPPPMPTGANASFNASNSSNLNVKDSFSKFFTHIRPKVVTFWTTCIGCRMQLECFIADLNSHLICNNCGLPFVAIETEAPVLSSNSSSTPWASQNTLAGDLCASGRNVFPNSPTPCPDKSKRVAYDQKRNGRYTDIPDRKPPPPMPTGANASFNSSNSNNLNVKDSFSKFPTPHFQPKLNTFWTTCIGCRRQFECFIADLNSHLICNNCGLPFVAIETEAPVLSSNRASTPWASQNTLAGDLCASGRNVFPNSPTPCPDKSKRVAYDQKRNGRYADIPVRKPPPPMPTGANASFNSSNSNNLNVKDSFSKFPTPHFQPKVNTFWTTCIGCRMQFECFITDLNSHLICNNCGLPFVAIETEAPVLSSISSSTPWASQNTMAGDLCASGRETDPATVTRAARCSSIDLKKMSKSGAFSEPSSNRSAATTSSSAAGGIEPSCAALKRMCEETATAFMRDEAFQVKTQDSGKGPGLSTGSCGGSNSAAKRGRPKKRRCEDEQRISNNERVVANENSTGKGGVGVSGFANGSFETREVEIAGKQKPIPTRKLWQLEIRNMLMDKAKKEIHKKLDERDMDTVLKTVHESRSSGEEIKKKIKSTLNGAKSDGNRFVDFKAGVQVEKSSPANSDTEPGKKDTDAVLMSVLDPDFHDFDGDRTEMSFGQNQVWAAYDYEDGMPRYYAMINNVISLKPFKVQISWLKSKSKDELAPLNWVRCGFPKTSGVFRRGKLEIKNNLNSFSHEVRWTKGKRGAIQIYPRKGDVWAVYRNWCADWDEHIPNEVIHKYDMVEVLEDYNETGVSIVALIKVAGFKTVFRRPLEQSKTKKIPREEISRLSHQVPSYVLTGQEGHNAPKGCLELDPASTPLELLQVLTEAQVEEMETAGKAKEE